jgi:phage/plasmid primase P4
MAKKVSHSEDYERSMEVVTMLSDELYSAYSKKELRMVIQSALFGDRVFGYEFHVRSACAKVLRYYEDSVYYFNGRYWSPLSDVLLEQALNGSLVKAHINKSDLVKARSNILRAAKQGASMSKLSPSRFVVGFNNGVYDFTDIDNPVCHSFSDRMDILTILPYEYSPASSCPKWLSFLKAVLTPAQVSLLQKYLSLGIAPRDSTSRKIEETLWLVGSGANGKSVIFEVVKAVYGDTNISSMSLHNLIKDGDDGARFRAVIVGKIFNYCTEVNTSDIGRYEGNFKSLCSGEQKEYRRIGGNVEVTDDIPYLVFNMNKKPSNRSMGEAFMRRLLLIHFRTTVSKQDMRPDLVSELCTELSGIRNWLIQGYKLLKEDGFKFIPTKESLAETEDYLLENGQTVQIFLRQKEYRPIRYSGHWDEKPKYVAAQTLYNDYYNFCEKKMYEAETMNRFGREMKLLGYEKRKNSSNNIYEVFCDHEISYALNI